MADNYEIRRFRAADKGEPGYAQGTDWIQAVGFGFHDTRRNDEFVGKIMAMYRSDDRELTGVYQTGEVAARSLGADIPVATFGTLRKNMNVGYGRQLRTHMVTAVTVRGTHRRQGLLRRMMTEDLTAAKADGLAMAALTASDPRRQRRESGRHGGSGGLGAGTVPGRRGPRLHLSGCRLSRDPESRRPDHRARTGGCAESAAHVRRRTLAALPDAFLTAFRQVTGLRSSRGALTGVGECD
ncbi:GNAT family N-acetyltransferase [Burkholderia sp. RS01]|uniref:GNAT family N-acetyltransferase n=1 Tax=Burkholderia sp. RS01 TaxID=3139774 RepID=UPI003218A217